MFILPARARHPRNLRPARTPAWSALLLAGLVGWVAGCARRPSATARQEFTSIHMAIPFRIAVYASDPVTATNAARAAFARIEELNGILSDYLPESELNRFSATAGNGEEVPLSPSLATVLLASQEIASGSNGAFDATVGPVVQLWRRARRQRQLPDATRLETARAAVGWTNLVLTGRLGSPGGVRGRLLQPGMRLDLGGIAKGHALDEAARILREHGLRAFLVAGAGDLVAGDPPPGTRGWRVELPPLDAPDAPPSQFVNLSRAALCTSGDLFQHVEIDGRRYSHIVDPRTGVGLVDHSLVTVIGRTGMETDALATAASVLPPDAALRLCRSRRVEARIVRRPGNVVETHATPGFRHWLD